MYVVSNFKQIVACSHARVARATLPVLWLLAQTLQPLLEELQPQAIEFPAMLGQIRLSQSLPIARANGFAGRHGGIGQLRGDCRWSAPFRPLTHVPLQRVIACIMCLAAGEHHSSVRGDCSIDLGKAYQCYVLSFG